MVLIPITSPRMFSKGPPLLPGLMAASVWIKRWNWPSPMLARFIALTIPAVTVSWAERRTDGHGPIADLHSVGVRDRYGSQIVTGVDFQNRDVGFTVETDHAGAIFGVIAMELHFDVIDDVARGFFRNHVLIGQDVAVLVDDKSGTGLFALAFILGHRQTGGLAAEESFEQLRGAVITGAAAFFILIGADALAPGGLHFRRVIRGNVH